MELGRFGVWGAQLRRAVDARTAELEQLGCRDLFPVALEQAIVLDRDPSSARAKARGYLDRYLRLPNYTDNWLRHGYTEADLADGGSNDPSAAPELRALAPAPAAAAGDTDHH